MVTEKAWPSFAAKMGFKEAAVDSPATTDYGSSVMTTGARVKKQRATEPHFNSPPMRGGQARGGRGRKKED